MAREDEQAPSRIDLPPQVVPEGFEPFKASLYSTHIGPAFVRKETDGASLVQPTLARMCNSGGALHGGYMMSFADTAITRAAAMTSDLAPPPSRSPRSSCPPGDISAPLITRVEVPKQGRSIAFLRGLLEQNGRALLSYSDAEAVMHASPRIAGVSRVRPETMRSSAALTRRTDLQTRVTL